MRILLLSILLSINLLGKSQDCDIQKNIKVMSLLEAASDSFNKVFPDTLHTRVLCQYEDDTSAVAILMNVAVGSIYDQISETCPEGVYAYATEKKVDAVNENLIKHRNMNRFISQRVRGFRVYLDKRTGIVQGKWVR